MLRAILNSPTEAKFIKTLVEDEKDLQLMMPYAEIPFNEKQWLAKFDPAIGTLSFKVLSGDLLVGHFAFLRVDKKLKEATLGLIYLAPHLRKTGASKELISLAEDVAIDLDIKNILLNVREFNRPAYLLYLKSGYVEYSREAELIRMKKTLSTPSTRV